MKFVIPAKVAEALRQYLAKRRADQITEQLNRVYAAHPITADQRRVIQKMRSKVTLSSDDRW